jgi:hypothetical protein
MLSSAAASTRSVYMRDVLSRPPGMTNRDHLGALTLA